MPDFTPKQAAEYLGVTVSAVEYAIQKGTLRAFSEANGRKRIELADLKDYALNRVTRGRRRKAKFALPFDLKATLAELQILGAIEVIRDRGGIERYEPVRTVEKPDEELDRDAAEWLRRIGARKGAGA